MPRLYMSTNDFADSTAALAFPFQVGQLQARPGALDRVLATASRRVDGYCRKRVQSPGVTTVGTGGITAGATALPVPSTLGFDGGQEQAVILGAGATQEMVAIVPGGVKVTSWTPPYPGTITLAQGTAFAHSAGETVQGCYQEVSTVGNSGSSDAYSESLIALNQAAQMARAHAPQFDTGHLTRVIFLKCYPIQQIFRLEHMLPIDTAFGILDNSSVGIEAAAGYIRLPLGSFVLPEGLFRTTYTAGFTNVPDEIAEAASWYAADELQTMISQGSYDRQQGQRKYRFGQPMQGKSLYVQRAEDLLDRGFRRYT